MSSFSLLTLNSFGLPFFLGLNRMKILARELSHLAPSVICLQEIQQNVYLPILRDRLTGYPHQAYQRNSPAPMGGLVTASQTPFLRSEFLPFPNRGKWFSIGFADWALRKGVLITEVEIDGLRVIALNTHIHANYMGYWHLDNSLAQIQQAQVQYLAEQACAQPKEALVIICGDFNFPRRTFLYDELKSKSGFVDPLAEDPRPTYRPISLMAAKWAITLDFIFYRVPENLDLSISANVIEIENSSAQNASSRFLTDHCALALDATWR